ncbi:MAG: phosphoribosylformylglycinamidine cyclo-ligase [Chitinispirillaceae bacterium]|nr:phosphoribosylformylglycinamidine cyclo-ligase [Chitinispirillaceae bacterium]
MKKSLSYKEAGVDVSMWNSVKGKIGELVSSTYNEFVLGKFGQFGGLFDISSLSGFKRPVLASSTDSVGTKVKIAFETGKHSLVGHDIVNHCVNDILVMGAKPLFFLDYIGIHRLDPKIAEEIVRGLSEACKKNNCVLIGGETAEMPDLYRKGEYDLVGTIIGIVDYEHIIDGRDIVAGDVLIGLRSSGLHTNGYTLARKIVTEIAGYSYNDKFEDSGLTFGEVLQEPHRSYLRLYPFMERALIKGCAHITGGGFQDNVDRILPSNCNAVIETDKWEPDPIFKWLQKNGNIDKDEMYHTFNMGIGMVVVVPPENVDEILYSNELYEFNPVKIGKVVNGSGKVILE